MKIRIIIYSFLALYFSSCSNDKNLIRYVDPFIGSDAHGHVFVGANVPFGGVQVGPANFHKGWDWTSSYHTMKVTNYPGQIMAEKIESGNYLTARKIH